MASTLVAMASTLEGMGSNLIAMASNLRGMASKDLMGPTSAGSWDPNDRRPRPPPFARRNLRELKTVQGVAEGARAARERVDGVPVHSGEVIHGAVDYPKSIQKLRDSKDVDVEVSNMY